MTAFPLQTTSVTVRPPFSSDHLVYHYLLNAFLFYLTNATITFIVKGWGMGLHDDE